MKYILSPFIYASEALRIFYDWLFRKIRSSEFRQLERELEEAREWADHPENPLFDRGWGMGYSRGMMVKHYTSTACMHERHGECRKVCKFCERKCRCYCHFED